VALSIDKCDAVFERDLAAGPCVRTLYTGRRLWPMSNGNGNDAGSTLFLYYTVEDLFSYLLGSNALGLLGAYVDPVRAFILDHSPGQSLDIAQSFDNRIRDVKTTSFGTEPNNKVSQAPFPATSFSR
jgi:hypothetical protein